MYSVGDFSEALKLGTTCIASGVASGLAVILLAHCVERFGGVIGGILGYALWAALNFIFVVFGKKSLEAQLLLNGTLALFC